MFENMFTFCAIFIGVVFVLIIVTALVSGIRRRHYLQNLTNRLPDVDYTEILNASTGERGSISMMGSDGGIKFGSYHSQARTKFLVVYKSGAKEIVSLNDNTPLFNAYVQLLKK